MPPRGLALILHAGAGTYPKDRKRAFRIQKKLQAITAKGYQLLKTHSAIEAVVQTVRWLEDMPETNAGTGSALQADGKARLSASLMEGRQMKFSGVINIEKVKNPILIAQLLQNEPDRLLASQGASQFAQARGFKLCDTRTQASTQRWKALRASQKSGHYGTVGACALDERGHLAAATSTGGKGMEQAGRVSDSALPSGNYANGFAAVSATGLGEDIIEEALASTLTVRAQDLNSLEKAFRVTFQAARSRGRLVAAIGLDRSGNVFWDRTAEILYYSFKTPSRSGIFQV